MDIVFVAVAAFAAGCVVTALGSHWLRKNDPAQYAYWAAKAKELEAKLEAATK
jgi:hypothetical protein